MVASSFQIYRCKSTHCQVLDPLMSQGNFLWSGKVLVCMLLFFMETVCMVAFLLALFSLLKKKKFQLAKRLSVM